MSEDLVNRLRGPVPRDFGVDDITREAADRIEALKAALRQAENHIRDLAERLGVDRDSAAMDISTAYIRRALKGKI